MAKLYVVKPSPGKGEGVFAKKTFLPSSVIMQDKATMKLLIQDGQIAPEAVEQAFQLLTKSEQQQFLGLHESQNPYKTKMTRIHKANCWSKDAQTHILLNASKINHSCVPNATLASPDDDPNVQRLVALKSIKKDEEILIDYSHFGNGMTRAQRQRYLRFVYSFECSCVACSLQSEQLGLSDARRQLYNVLKHKTDGVEPLDVEALSRIKAVYQDGVQVATCRQVNGKRLSPPLTPRETVAYSMLLAGLMEAEGLLGGELGLAYSNAYATLTDQMDRLNDIYIFPTADYTIILREKALNAMARIDGWGSQFIVALGKELEEQKATDSSIKSTVKQSTNMAFAAQFEILPGAEVDLRLTKVMSQAECKALIRQRSKGKR